MKSNRQDRKTFLSLYCGCGGLDYAFHKQDYNCLGAFDIDRNAVKSYNQNYGEVAVQKDLSDKGFSVPNLTEVDLVVSGSPCQGFSTLGKRDFDDPRNHLLTRAAEIAIQHNARYFVAENVPGVLSGPHSEWWESVTNLLNHHGFSTNTLTVCANDYGVPQLRKRVFLIGIKGASQDIFNQVELPRKRKAGTVGEALGAAARKNSLRPLEGNDLLVAKRIKQGQKLCDVRGGGNSVHTWEIPEVFGQVKSCDVKILQALMKARRASSNRVRDVGDGDPVDPKVLDKMLGFSAKRKLRGLEKMGYVKFDPCGKVNLAHTFNGKYKRLPLDGYSPTVDTNFGNPRYFLHPTEHRGISAAEMALLQGFPKKYRFTGSEKQKMKLIGNAVPPPVSAVIASYINRLAELDP